MNCDCKNSPAGKRVKTYCCCTVKSDDVEVPRGIPLIMGTDLTTVIREIITLIREIDTGGGGGGVETLTTLSLIGSSLTYQDETGGVTVIALPADVLTTISSDGTSLTYTDETGGTTVIPFPVNTTTTLSSDGTTLTYVDEAGSTTSIIFPPDVTTSLVSDGTTLTYTDETGIATPIPFPTDVTTTLSSDGTTLTYIDEIGAITSIPMAGGETTTTLSSDGTTLTYVDEVGATTSIPFPVDVLTTLSTDGIALTYIDELGGTTTVPFPVDVVTTLSSDGITLTYVDEVGASTAIVFPPDVNTSISTDGTSFSYVDELGFTTTVLFPVDVLTSLSSDGISLTYVDELAAVTTIPFPVDVVTSISSDGITLSYLDELGATTGIPFPADVTTTLSSDGTTLTYVDELGVTTPILFPSAQVRQVEVITLAALSALVLAQTLDIYKIYKVVGFAFGQLTIDVMYFKPNAPESLETDATIEYTNGRIGVGRYSFDNSRFYYLDDSSGNVVSGREASASECNTLLQFPWDNSEGTTIKNCDIVRSLVDAASFFAFTNSHIIGSNIVVTDMMAAPIVCTFTASTVESSLIIIPEGELHVNKSEIIDCTFNHVSPHIMHIESSKIFKSIFSISRMAAIVVTISGSVLKSCTFNHVLKGLNIVDSELNFCANTVGNASLAQDAQTISMNKVIGNTLYFFCIFANSHIVDIDLDNIEVNDALIFTRGEGNLGIRDSQIMRSQITYGDPFIPSAITISDTQINNAKLVIMSSNLFITSCKFTGNQKGNNTLVIDGGAATGTIRRLHVQGGLVELSLMATIDVQDVVVQNEGHILGDNGAAVIKYSRVSGIELVKDFTSGYCHQMYMDGAADSGGVPMVVDAATFDVDNVTIQGQTADITLTGNNIGTYAIYAMNTLV